MMVLEIRLFAIFLATILFRGVQLKQDASSFSFFKFSGPVSGEVEEIYVTDHTHSPHYGDRKVDYMAKPDYSFHYGVQDTKTGNSQGHKETRNGNSVVGEYRVLQDDGLVRIVRYTADSEKGFQAHIEYVRLKQDS